MLTGTRRKCLASVALFVILLLITAQLLAWDETRWNRLREHAAAIIQPSQPSITPETNSPEPEPEPEPEPSPPQLPTDYFVESDDQKQCEKFYGISYIQNTAKKQHHYCEDGSLSSMQCFTADRIQGPWDSDPTCLARGAMIHRAPSKTMINLQCQLRNFTQEAERGPEAAAAYKDVQNVDEMGVYFFETGAGKEFQSWTFDSSSGDPACSAQSNNGEWILLARREGNVNLWHKLMEIWQAMLSVEAIRIARDPQTGKPYLSEQESTGIQVVFEDDRQEPLDDWWTVATGNPAVRMSSLPGACYGNVIVPLAGSSSPFWTFLLPEREHEVCRVRTLIDMFVSRIFSHLHIIPRLETDIHANPVVTIIDRKQTRKFRNLSSFVETLQARYPHVRFNVVDFAAISLLEQVKLVQETDVLVGHHGAGMTHVLFLPPEAAVVEIFPPVFPSLGFRHVARMRGLVHFPGHCMWPEEWNATANGAPLPEGWKAPDSEAGWQEAEWTYVAEDEFLGLIDAAIRSQQHRRINT